MCDDLKHVNVKNAWNNQEGEELFQSTGTSMWHSGKLGSKTGIYRKFQLEKKKHVFFPHTSQNYIKSPFDLYFNTKMSFDYDWIGGLLQNSRGLTHCFLLAFGWWRLLWRRHYDGGWGWVHSLSWVVWPSCGNWGWNRGWDRWGVPEGIWGCAQETGEKHFNKIANWCLSITQCLCDTGWLHVAPLRLCSITIGYHFDVGGSS